VARVQLFLSTVSAEFLSYRERLRHLLTRPDVEVKVQENFIVTGDEILEMLDTYIQGCDGVIHLWATPRRRWVERIPWRPWTTCPCTKLAKGIRNESRSAAPSITIDCDSCSSLWVVLRRVTTPTKRYHRRSVRQTWKLTLPLALALVITKLQALAAAPPSAPTPTPFDPSALVNGWLQGLGPVGKLVLFGGFLASLVLSRTEGFVALLRLFGWDRKPPEPQPGPRNETHGPNSPLITGGTLSSGGDQFIGGEHEHHTHLPPAPKPELPNTHTPHNLRYRTTSPDRFVGRATELQRLSQLLAPEGSRVYLTGMGGVGKSELALQHAYDSLEHYIGGIVRFDARLGVETIAKHLVVFFRSSFPSVSLPEDKNPLELLPFCWSQWPSTANPPEPVLIILDDQQPGDGASGLERNLFQGLPRRFHRLITQCQSAPTGEREISLSVLNRENALHLLALQAGTGGEERLLAEAQAADRLAAEVGDLPLALVLLGARLAERPDLGLAQLLDELIAKGPEARALQQAHPELGAERGVVETLLISWEPLSAEARNLAVLLGAMAPALIPWPLVESCRLPDQPLVEGSAFANSQVELLRSRLLQRSAANLYQLHPMVHWFLYLNGRSQPVLLIYWRRRYAAALVEVCRKHYSPTLTKGQQTELEHYLPHIQLVAEERSSDIEDSDIIVPYTTLGWVAEHQSDVGDAMKWKKLGLKQCRQRLGPKHPDTAIALVNLSHLLYSTDQLADAEPLMREALELMEAIHGPDDPRVATPLSNLASLLMKDARSAKEAMSLFQRALRIKQTQYGQNSPEMATTLNNFAQLLKDNRCYREAEQLMRRVLGIDELDELKGRDHPDVARDLNNLALLLNDDPDRRAEARQLMQRALTIIESNHVETDPIKAFANYNYALVLRSTGSPADAEPPMRRSVELLIAIAHNGYKRPELEQFLEDYQNLLHQLGHSEEEVKAILQELHKTSRP
jgi:tetratricopeptide (TPR) repeat protein